MPNDPTDRLIRAIEGLTRETKENNKLLKRVLDRGRRIDFTNHPYLEASNDDALQQGDLSSESEGDGVTDSST